MKFRKGCLLLPATLVLCSPVFAQVVPALTPSQPNAGSNSSVFTTPPDFPATSKEGIHAADIGENITSIEEKSLFFDASIGVHSDPGGEPSNGMRYYAITLKPQEKLHLQLTAEASNRVGMEFLMPAKTDPMIREFTRLRFMPKALRSSRMDIKNTTDQPYTLVLMAYGRINHWYKIKIERSM